MNRPTLRLARATLATAALVAGATAVRGDELGSRIVPVGFAVNIKSTKMSAAGMDRLAAAGIRGVRFDMHWFWVERERGLSG